MKRVCAYCRVSTDKDDQVNSLVNQRSFFEREITASGNAFVGVYADEGLTGTKLNNRPQFESMLRDAGINVSNVVSIVDKRRKVHTVYDVSERESLFDEIWVKNTSRFARNTLSYEIISCLRAKGINIRFMSEGINTMDMSQDLLLKLMQVFDENDSKDKSQKVRWGNAESAKQGKIRSNHKLFGYRYVVDETDHKTKRLVIVPEEAEIVREIFNLYAEGKGVRTIIRQLTAEGHFTREGKEFGKTTIRHILDNEKYAGLNNALKWDTGTVFIDKRTSPAPKEIGSYMVEATDKIEPIVSVELFNRCRGTLQSKVSYETQRGIYTGKSQFAGILFCGTCGKPYHRNVDKGRPFYNCSCKRSNGAKACSNPNISEKKLNEELERIAQFTYFETLYKDCMRGIAWITQEIHRLCDLIDADVPSEASRIQAEIDEKSETLNNYIDLYATQRVGKERTKAKIDALQSEIEALEAKVQELTKPNETLVAEIKLYAEKVTELYSTILKDCSDDSKTISLDDFFTKIAHIIIVDNARKPKVNVELSTLAGVTDVVGSEKWRTDAIETRFTESPLMAMREAMERVKSIAG